MSPIASDTIYAPATPAKHAHQSLKGLVDDPLDRTWRGDKVGTLKLDSRCPDFKGGKQDFLILYQ